MLPSSVGRDPEEWVNCGRNPFVEAAWLVPLPLWPGDAVVGLSVLLITHFLYTGAHTRASGHWRDTGLAGELQAQPQNPSLPTVCLGVFVTNAKIIFKVKHMLLLFCFVVFWYEIT